MTKHTILFLAANPRGTDQRALDLEASSIRKELKRSGYRDRFELMTRWAAEPHDLLRELRELKPTVVHFSGHGGHDGLFFQAAEGRIKVVTPAALVETFGAAGASVRLVVLSACYSDAPANALLAHVDCIVGMGGALPDDMAKAFAVGFYGALGEHESVAAAYRHGNAAISLEGLSDVDRPQLRIRNGFDATQLVLAANAPAVRVALPCPYPGMRPYSADDVDYFHGRDADIEELLGRLRAGEREIYVIGPSGSGKSSLVGAGVLPRLARGVAGLGQFVVRTMRPGEHPAARLAELLETSEAEVTTPANAIAALLSGRAASAAVLIVVDQLEELFTLAAAGERERFLSELQALRAEFRCVIVFTLRADFFGALMESPLWPDRQGRQGQISRIEVAPLRGQALNEAIVRPARDLGVSVELELVERLLADAGSEPGVLPLLQETLVQLWDRRQGQTLTLVDYEALGTGDRSGLAVALSRRADATLRALTPAQKALARRILLRLVSFGEGRSDTRRQQPRSKLHAAGDDAADFEHVLQQLIGGRLLTSDDDDNKDGEARVDLAHEAMIVAWPTLASWIQTHRADEQRRRQHEAAAVQWVEHGCGERGLLDPIELADAEAWQRTESAHELGQSADVAALLAASRAAHDRQRRRRRGLVWGAFATLAVFAVVVATLAVVASQRAGEADDSRRQAEADSKRADDSRRQAETDRKRAEASDRESKRLLAQSYQETGRQQLIEGHLQEAMPYFMAARRNSEERESLQMLLWIAARSLPRIPPLQHQNTVMNAAFSPDGSRVVTASEDKTARIWDAASGKSLTPPLQHQNTVISAVFSPDGSRVVTASEDKTARIWDAASGKPLAFPLQHQNTVISAEFSPDGSRVVTASEDKTARIWDAASGKSLAPPLQHQNAVMRAAFSPDGSRVVTASADKTARVWDTVSGKSLAPPLQHQNAVISAVFSPDGSRVVTASADKTARVWDAVSGKPLAPSLQHQDTVISAAFSPDGSRVVTASADKTARVWDAVSGKPLAPSLQHQDAVINAAFSPDGSRVVTASFDHTARVWDAASGKPLGTPLQHQNTVSSAVFSYDGSRVLTASADKTARVWDAASDKPPALLLQHQDMVKSAAFSPDGSRVVTASDDHTARVWDAASGKPLTPPLQHQNTVSRAAFSPDGSRVLTTSFDHTARVWDAASGKPLTPPLQHQNTVSRAAFSPDGSRVVTASLDHTARVWDAASGKPLTPLLQHQDQVISAAFNHDGSRVVTASTDKTARVWDATSGNPLGPPLQHQALVLSAAFSPDGSRVVTASLDHTACVWDAASSKPLGPPLQHQDQLMNAAFSFDGSRVVTASDDHTARVWDAASGKPLAPPLQHQAQVSSATFSLDGSRVITASDDHTARVWDAVSGQPLAPPLQHQNTVLSATFSPDGSRVVTSSFDHTARVWDAASGQPLTPPLQHQAVVSSAAFSPDGLRVVTSSFDHTARVWETELDKTPPAEWSTVDERSPFVLSGSVHVLRAFLAGGTGAN